MDGSVTRIAARSLIAALSAAVLWTTTASAAVPGGWATPAQTPAQAPVDDQDAPAGPTAPGGWVDPDSPLGGGGLVDPPEPTAPSGPKPTVPGELAAVGHSGIAYAPKSAPRRVKIAIWAANQLRNKPYRWGGGHRSWKDSGYDCSGAVSYVLHAAGLLGTPFDSRLFMRYGKGGQGRWISIYANRGHVFMVIAGLRFDTSGYGEKGPRWRPYARSAAGFKVRHPAGF
jgi:cell wall-associated NlpC family hydrolase